MNKYIHKYIYIYIYIHKILESFRFQPKGNTESPQAAKPDIF